MSKASFVSLLVWELRLAKNFPIDLTDPVVPQQLNRVPYKKLFVMDCITDLGPKVGSSDQCLTVENLASKL